MLSCISSLNNARFSENFPPFIRLVIDTPAGERRANRSTRVLGLVRVPSAPLYCSAEHNILQKKYCFPLKHQTTTLKPVEPGSISSAGGGHTLPLHGMTCVCGRDCTTARERHLAEGNVFSLEGTLNFRIKFCYSIGITRSGDGFIAGTTSLNK